MCEVENESLRAKLSREEDDERRFKKACTWDKREENRQSVDFKRWREERYNLEQKIQELEKELKKCKEVKEDLETQASERKADFKMLRVFMNKFKSERDALEEEIQAHRRKSKLREKISLHNAGANVDVGICWLLDKMEQFRSERDNLQSRVDEQWRKFGQREADLSRCLADKANLQKMLRKSSRSDNFGLKQTLLQCQLEKEQLQATVNKYKLDIDILESRMSRQEGDKKHARDVLVLLKARLEAAGLKDKSLNNNEVYDSQEPIAAIKAEVNEEDSSGKVPSTHDTWYVIALYDFIPSLYTYRDGG